MMEDITHRDYWNEIASIAESVFGECKEYERDPSDVLWEWVDGHSWIIYTYKATKVMEHTDNPDSYFVEIGEGLSGDSWGEIVSKLAFFAMLADVQESQEWIDGMEAFEG